MFYYLVQHPNIFNTPIKEPHFLAGDFPSLHVTRTPAEYAALFNDVGPQHTLVGEASVSYLYSSQAAGRILELEPKAKLILMLRNPLEIIHSWHMHSLAMLNETERDFSKAWQLQDERAAGRRIPPKCAEPFFLQYREIGKLGTYLNKLRAQVPETQLKLIFHEDLKADLRAVYDDLLTWLGAPPFAAVDFRVMNESKTNRSQLLAHVTERDFGLSITRQLKPLRKWLGLENVSLRSKLRRMNRVRQQRSPLDPDFAMLLKDYFRDDVQLLEQLSGRDLSHWLN